MERVSEGHRQRSWNREQDGDQGQGEYLGEDGVWGELGAKSYGAESPIIMIPKATSVLGQ